MQKPLTVEKTTKISVQGKEVSVASLPLSVRYEIDTLDAFREKEVEAYLALEAIALAVLAKEQSVKRIISELLSKTTTPSTDEAGNDSN